MTVGVALNASDAPNQVDATVRGWGDDPKAPRWLNALEARLAGRRAGKAAGSRQPC